MDTSLAIRPYINRVITTLLKAGWLMVAINTFAALLHQKQKQVMALSSTPY